MFNEYRPTSLAAKALIPCALFASAACAQEQLWIEQIGSIVSDSVGGVAVDGVGGVFVGGSTSGSLGGSSAGGGDAWLARYDIGGDQIWIEQFGTSVNDSVGGCSPDGAGGVFVVGGTQGDLGGPNAGGFDIFFARYDSAGGQVWIKQIGSTESDTPIGAAPDGSGGFYACGYTSGDLGGPALGDSDVWLGHFDSEGNQLWITHLGSTSRDAINAISEDGAGGVVLGGWTVGLMGAAIIGAGDAWLARYDSSGNQVWIRQFGTTSNEDVSGITPDGSGGFFAGGTARFSFGGPSAGLRDAWIGRFDGGGNQVWIHQFGSSDNDYLYAVTQDGAGGAFLTGYTDGDLGGPSSGGSDVWFARYDGAGTQVGVDQFGSDSNDSASVMTSDGASGFFAGGITYGSLAAPGAGNWDAWFTHYGNACYADCDKSTGNGVLDVFDFLCFQNSFVNAEPYACDCDTSTGNGVCDVFDFLCFQNAFVGGCP